MKKIHQPPKLPLQLFRFYCNNERLEELEGDLSEEYNEFIYEKGIRYSKLYYWWMVIRGFRSYALKRKNMKNDSLLSTIVMFFSHNMTITLRNLIKYKTTTFINVLGLAVGISAFLVIYRIIGYETSFNQHISDGERIYRVYTEYTGNFSGTNSGVSGGIPTHLRDNLTGLERLSHFNTFNYKVKKNSSTGSLIDIDHNVKGIIADIDYFKIVNQYKWLSGSPEASLSKSNQVVLTEKTARLYFEYENIDEIIGKSLFYRDSLEVIVSGIVKKSDHQSDFDFTEFISYETINQSWLKEFITLDDVESTQSSSQLFIKLSPNVSDIQIESQLAEISENLQEKREDPVWIVSYHLQTLNDLHYNGELKIFDNTIYPPANLEILKILGLIAIFLIFIAVFNFINLETARASTRAKEIGVRKVMGSHQSMLIFRFLTESITITFLAGMLALPITYFSLQFFSDYVPEGVTLGVMELDFWVFLIALILFTGLAAGAYPSIIISSYSPSNALKNTMMNKQKTDRSLLRKSFITFQFVFSQFLIIGTIAVLSQISYILNKDVGFESEGIAYFYAPYYDNTEKLKVMLQKLESISEITSISRHTNPPAIKGYNTTTFKHVKNDEEINVNAHRRGGDTNYMDFHGVKIIAGRNIIPSEEMNELLINDSFRKALGYQNPDEALGINIGDKYKVAGVIEDFNFMSLHNRIEPLFYRYNEDGRCFSIKIPIDENLHKTIAKVSTQYEELYPNTTFKVYFQDDTIDSFYENEKRTSKLASTATGISIFISCLGLFGLISFTTVQRSKEIGIRKVLGATIMQIGSSISKEFVTLILISLLFSIPLSYYVINKWIENFEYRMGMSWWIFAVGGLLSIITAFLTIAAKIWRASNQNPVDSLRYE